ncbi:GerAB/ArcD/ProY family transporter [Calidifontibacillus erzurumensis]|uniref:Endospore germination permease n=1 Tax=Calidifontibacillus erzurumensis TaxID=2741433 RepID=A0A8J8GIN7_9BACI|nr:endospore germination permease [Calidifontibacillus erzurumensis]NSL52456.1 endospore germination permease [Calidifontibacillus erzurumensis]
MDNTDRVSPIHIIFLITTASGFNTHVFLIHHLISSSGRDAWISVLITMVLAILWAPLLFFIHKKTYSESIFNLIENRLGKKLSLFLLSIMIIYFTLISIVTLRETITWTTIAYLPETPQILVSMIIISLCWYLSISKFSVMNVINVLLLTFIIIFGLFVGISNIQFKNYSLIMPMLEYGYRPVIEGVFYQASGVMEITLFLLLQHKIKKPFRFRHLFIAILFLTILTLGPLLGAIAEFGVQEAQKQRFPAYEQWNLVSIGIYINHVDFLSIYQWLSGIFIRISLFLFIVKETIKVKNTRIKNLLLLMLSIVIAGGALIPITDFQFLYLVKKFILPASFIFFFSLPIILTMIVFIKPKNERGQTNEV